MYKASADIMLPTEAECLACGSNSTPTVRHSGPDHSRSRAATAVRLFSTSAGIAAAGASRPETFDRISGSDWFRADLSQ